MNIRFLTAPSTFEVQGGLRRQLTKTKQALEELGHSVEVVSSLKTSVPSTDLIHVFGANPSVRDEVEYAVKSGIPTVVSTVLFSNRSAATLRRAIQFQAITRWTGWMIKPDLHDKVQICRQATHLAPNTNAESNLLMKAFGINQNKITVIPNGVDVNRFTQSTPDQAIQRLGFDSYLLYVGDLQAARKNVQKLIEVYQNHHTDHQWPPLVLAGRLTSHHPIAKMIQGDSSITWVGALDADDPLLDSLYRAAKAFILPSQFETPGIAAMEAALSNCSIAITEAGGTKEVFGENAHYLNPFDEQSIIQAIDDACSTPPSTALHDRLHTLDWSEIGKRTEEMYQYVRARANEASASINQL